MKRELALEFSRVTESAALAAFKWLGKGDKMKADGAAVMAMRAMLNTIDICGKVVIGEGKIDEAPMLYHGEIVGNGCSEPLVDIAVDPIEGTRMVAVGQSNAISAILVSEADTLLTAPDMYMEKLIVGPEAKGVIDLNLPLEENLKNISKAMKKDIDELVVIILDKDRHQDAIKMMHDLGVRVYAIPDGDVAGGILTCVPFSPVDCLYGIGGAPEGVLAAGAVRSLGGDMQARLILRSDVKGKTPKNLAIDEEELKELRELKVEANRVYTLEEMIRTDNIIFSATGITKGDLLEGVVRNGDIFQTETMLIRGKTRTIRMIKTTHDLRTKTPFLIPLIK